MEKYLQAKAHDSFVKRVVSTYDTEVFALRRMMGCDLDQDQSVIAGFGTKGFDLVALAEGFLDREKIRHDRMSEGPHKVLYRAFTNSDLPEVFKDAVNLTVLDGYRAAPATFSAWTRRQGISNTHTAYFSEWAISQFGEVMQGEELSSTGFADRGASGQIQRFRGVASITFEALVNGRLGNLRDMSQRIGIAARQTALKEAYKTLLLNPVVSDGKAVFHADHGNLIEDQAPVPPLYDHFSRAAKALRNQTDAAGNKLNLAPATVLCPPSLEGAAMAMVKEINQDDNPWQRPVYVVSEPWLEDESLENSSSTDWYICADPAEAAMFGELAFDGLPIEQRIRTVMRDAFTSDVYEWFCSFETGFCPTSTIGMVKLTTGE
jgi:hypothetical protein